MAKWTKQTYELVAKIIKAAECSLEPKLRSETDEAAEDMRTHLAEQFAHRFKLDNPNFKSHVFHKACGTFPQQEGK